MSVHAELSSKGGLKIPQYSKASAHEALLPAVASVLGSGIISGTRVFRPPMFWLTKKAWQVVTVERNGYTATRDIRRTMGRQCLAGAL